MIYETGYESPIGSLTIRSDGSAITQILFEQTDQDIKDTVIRRTKIWLDAYFAGKQPDPKEIPLNLQGTEFQKTVWHILRSIPYGKTMTYGQIAGMTERRMSAQAIGQAVGKNPIPIIVPCHRVLGANRKITGFSGGLEKKRFLLAHENILYIE